MRLRSGISGVFLLILMGNKMKKLLFIFLSVISLTACYETKEGEKIGSIVKLAKEGIIFNTWEGQLIRGGLQSGSGSFGAVPFNFTVEDEDTLIRLKKALEDQKEIKVKYHRELVVAFWRSDRSADNYFVDSFEEIKK